MKFILALITGVIFEVLNVMLFDASSAEGYITFLVGYTSAIVCLKD